jgi:hypothetical protein
MTLFLCGLLTGLGIGAVAAYLTIIQCVIPSMVGYTAGTIVEMLYDRGVLKVDPADEAELRQNIEDAKQYPWNTTHPSTPASGITSKR